MNEGAYDNHEYSNLPTWKRDILISNIAFNNSMRGLHLKEKELILSYSFGSKVTKALDKIGDLLPEYILFSAEEYGTARDSKAFGDIFPTSARKYYLPKTHEVFTFEKGGLANNLQRPENYPESENFVGFDKLRESSRHGQLYIIGSGIEGERGVFMRKVDKDKNTIGENGEPEKTISFFPNEAEQLVAAAAQLLGVKIELGKKGEALVRMKNLLQRYFAEKKELDKSFAPQIKQRILNLRDAILRCPYKLLLPKIVELKKYSSEAEDPSYFFIVHEGKLIKSDSVPRKNLFRRIRYVPDAIEASDDEFVMKAGDIESGLTSVLPPGWSLWGK